MITPKEKSLLAFMLYQEKMSWTVIGKLEDDFGISISSSSGLAVDNLDYVLDYIGMPRNEAVRDSCLNLFAARGGDFSGLIDDYLKAAGKVNKAMEVIYAKPSVSKIGEG